MSLEPDARRSRADIVNLDSGLEALQASPEFSGSVESLDGDHCNDHLAHLFEDPAEQVATAIPFLRQGLERGERCMYVVDRHSKGDIVGAMRDAGVDVDAALDSGALTFHTVEDTYLRDGSFDADEMIEFYAAAIDEATEEYEALRISAETTWMRDASVTFEDFMEYESKVNELFDEEDVIAICHYDRTAFPPEVVRDIIETHPHLVYDGTVCHNFYYTPPSEYGEPDRASREVERMMGTLLERTEAKVELQTRERFLRRMYEMTSDPGRSFREKVEQLLELGCERLDLDIGYFATVDSEADTFEIVEAVGGDEQIAVGASGPLSTSYCEKVLLTDRPVSVVDAPAEGWGDDPAYDTYGLDAYLGTTLHVEGQQYGTLCFASRTPRAEPFTEPERTFVEMMSQWTSYELERSVREQSLRALYEITSDPDGTFDEKLQRLFELGCDRFDLEFGGMAQVDPETDAFEVDAVSGSHDHLVPGAEVPLSETYCRAVGNGADIADITDPIDAGFGGTRAHEEFGVERYFGTGVELDGELDRTLFFVSSERREAPYPEAKRAFLDLMGQWVEYELERKDRERRLERQKAYTDDILDAVDDVFYVVDENGSIKRWNDAAIDVTGRSDVEDSSTNALEFFDESDRDRVANGISEVFESGSARVEAELRTDDGESIPYEFVASALEEPDGTRVLTGIGRDVSERVCRERSQRELYELTASKDLAFDEKIERLLELGCERFGLDQGYVTQFHRDAGVVENQHAVGPDDQELRTGTPDAQAKPGQYCRRTVEADEPLGATDVRELGWEDDPVHRENGLESYFGVKITDGAGPYGTLAFCDREIRDEPFTDTERTFLELMGQWVSHLLEQRRREDQLAALNEMSRAIMARETDEEITEVAVEFASASLDLPLTAVVTYDGHTGDLSPSAQTPRADDELPTTALCERDGGALWEPFVSSEASVLDDVADLPGAGEDITETLVVPLGQQGLFVTATTAPDGFSDAEDDLVAATAATVETAFTRAEREEQLHEREAMLEEQNDTMSRLNRVNDIIRNIDQSLVRATSRDEIGSVVCDQLAEVGPYEMAWIGEHDAVTDEIVPIEWAGAEKGYLEEMTVTADDGPEGQGPAGRTVRAHESQVVDEILQDDSFRPWRQEALNRGYHSCISLPLVYGETLYGIVVVYAGQPGVFGELERSVLDELSDTIAYAINAVESKKALVSDEVTRLEFEVEDSNFELIEIAEELDCTFSQESVVPRSDGGVRDYFSSRGASAEDVLTYVDRLPAVEVTLISEYEEDGEPVCLFESDLTDESLTATVLAHGGQTRGIVVEDGSVSVTVDVAADAAVREFVEMFRTKFPGSELVAQRSLERPSRTPTEHRVSLTEQLTDRQLEALQTAFYAGYFEQPRVQKGTDVAETLDVSQPTFTSHLRSAHRKVCRQLFDDDTLEP